MPSALFAELDGFFCVYGNAGRDRSIDRPVAQDKVDVVKMTMQDNIQQMLANEERLDQISENAENLNEQVRVTRKICDA